MAITEKLIVQEEAAAGGDANPNIMLDLNAGDVDSYDGDGDVWYDIHDFEFKPTTNVSEHFNTVLYTGDGTNDSTKSITGVGFTPDFVWIKNRDTGSNHYVTDSVRGDNKHIYTESTSIENGNSVSSYGGVLLNSDGFTVNKGTNSSSVGTNATGDDYVAWCFNAGGVEETNTEGTIDSTVRANNDLGFSVAKYTATGVTATVGHGLDTPPEMIIAKTTNQAYNWMVYHKDLGASNYLMLNSTNASASSSAFMNNTSPTSSVFTAGAGQNLNYANNDEIVTYNFTSKRGVSKVGSYTGTGTSGNKVYTGFEPAFLLQKETNTSGVNWHIWDNARDSNPIENVLSPNTSSAEGPVASGITFNRDGFTINTTNGSINGNGDNYIYYAIAKDTNETELADTVGFKPSIDPEDHFNTVLFQSNNQVAQSITGVGFQPDLILGKTRQDAASWDVIDSVRGGDKFLSTDRSYGQSTGSYITSFDTDGFTLGTASNFNYYNNRQSVAFCFKAGGAASLNQEGTIDSQVSVNNDLGFSIATYTGNGTANQTVGNGLDSPVELLIVKKTNGTGGNWLVWNRDVTSGNGKYLYLDLSNGIGGPAGTPVWDSSNTTTMPTSGLFNVNTNALVNAGSGTYVAYSFISKRGVSKVGSYTGNGSNTGPVVYTEFEPAFVMIKETSSTGYWIMLDNKRNPSDPRDNPLYPNENWAEDVDQINRVDFNRDGFQVVGTGGDVNASSQNYIYLAFAKNTNNEQPHLELNLEADSYSGSGDWLDSSGNGNDGTITGATWEEELGNFFEFNGSSDKVSITDSSPVTLEIWVKANATSGTDALAGHASITSNYIYWNSGDLTVNGAIFTSLDKVTDWTHIALVESGSNLLCYKNGDLIQTIAGALGAYNLLGARTAGTAQYLNGKIGQVRMYSSALSQEQIRQNFNFTKPKYPNEFHGDIIGTPSWNSEGSFNISGGNYIDLGSDAALNFSKDSSISVWVNPSNSTGNKGIITRVVNTSPFGYVLSQSSGNTSFTFYDSSGNSSSSSSASLPNNTWTHLAVTYDGSNLIFYKNGSVVSTTASTLTPYTAPANTLIGRYYSNINVTTYDFAGKISKVRAYNKALTQAEITALYNEGN